MAETAAVTDRGRALDDLRTRGAQRIDPMRLRVVEALARRAAAHEGAARRVLDARLAALIQALGDDVERRAMPPANVGAATRSVALAELVDHIARRRLQAAGAFSTLGQAASPHRASPADADGLAFFKRTWFRLSANRRLAQSRSALPQNAGPLNSQQVVHRSLMLMHELSPAYLDRFIAYVDALLWVESSAQAGKTSRVIQPGGRRR